MNIIEENATLEEKIIQANETPAEAGEEIKDAYEVSDSANDIVISETNAKEIDELNYLELTILKKKLTAQLEELEQGKELAETYEQMNKSMNALQNDSFGLDEAETIQGIALPRIHLEDSEEKQMNEEIGEFKDAYDETYQKTTDMIKYVDNRLGTFTTEITTSYLSQDLIESINKKIELVEKSNKPNKIFYIKKLKNLVRILENRTDYDYINKKIHHPAVCKRVREFNNLVKKGYDFKLPMLCRNFTDKQLIMVKQFLCENATDGDILKATLFMYHMDKVYEAEQESGNYMYIKSLFLMMIDIENGICDLVDKEIFIRNMRDMFIGAY